MSNGNKGTGVVVAVLVSLVVGGFGGYMLGNVNGQKAAQMEQQAVATVNGEKITKDDLYKRMVTEAGSQIVQQLIQEKLVDQEAAKANIEVAPAEIDAEIAKIREQVGGEQQLQAALAQNNLTMDQLRDIQVMRLKLEKILMPQIPMDDAALKAYFDENRAQFDKREVSARHILVATEAEAKAVREELDKGADFATLAKEKSTEPAAKTSGGDLGTFGPGQMVPEFDAVVFNLKKGETSQPFQTSFGWHVAQVTDVKGTAPDYDAMKEDVKKAYVSAQVQERAQALLTELQDKAKIENMLEAES